MVTGYTNAKLKFKGGVTVSTGTFEVVEAYRGSYRPRKTGRKHIIAENYDYALAA